MFARLCPVSLALAVLIAPASCYAGAVNLYSFGPGSHPTDDVVIDLRGGADGTVTGGEWINDNPPRNFGAWDAQVSGDQIVLPLDVDLSQGTYQGWFRTYDDSANWSNPLATAIRDTQDAQANDSMRIELNSSRTYSVYGIPRAGSPDGAFQTHTDQIDDGQWHLLTLTYAEGSPVKLYVDDVLEGQSGFNYESADAIDRGDDLIGHRHPGGGSLWKGSVGTFAYFDRVLTETEVAETFAQGMHIPEPVTGVLLMLGTLLLLPLRRRRGR